MVKGTLKCEDVAFDVEGEFGMIMITKLGDNGAIDLKAASFGKGNAVETAYALGQGIGNTLNALAGKNPAKRVIVRDAFIKGMVKCQE